MLIGITKIYFLTLLLFQCGYLDCRSSIRNIFTNHTISEKNEYVHIDIHIEPDLSHFSIVFKVFKAIHTVYCELSFDLTTVHGKNYQNFFDKTYDYCAFMVKPPSEFLMLLVHGELSKAGLWMRKCPVEKKTYKANNFTLNLERFPLFTPEARYNVTLMWTTKLKEEIVHLATITVLGRFESTVEVVRRRKAIGRKPTQPKTQPKTREFKPTS